MKKYFSFKTTPEIAARLKACYDEQQAIYNLILEGTDAEDVKTGQSMGTGDLVDFCRKALKAAIKFPSKLVDEDASFTVDDFIASSDFKTFWREFATQRTSISNQEVLIEGLSDRALMSKAGYVHAQMGRVKDLPKYKADYDELHSMYSNRADLSKETTKTNARIQEANAIIRASKESK
jgi:hypothetical protein